MTFNIAVIPPKVRIGGTIKITGKLKVDIGHYKYVVLIDGEKAREVPVTYTKRKWTQILIHITPQMSNALNKEGEHTAQVILYKKESVGRLGLEKWIPVDKSNKIKFKVSKEAKRCDVGMFRYSVLKNAKRARNFVRIEGKWRPVLNVTSIVRHIDPEVERAELVLLLDQTDKIQILQEFTSLPPARKIDEIVNGWYDGYEIMRQYCPLNGMYYYVKYPVKLRVWRKGKKEETPPKEEKETPPKEEKEEKKDYYKYAVVTLSIIFIAYSLYRIRGGRT